MSSDLREQIGNNPFFMLGVGPNATRVEVERTGQRLLGQLALGQEAARHYASPVGPRERTADAIRLALAELRDPPRRILHEFWASIPWRKEAEPTSAIPWNTAARVFGLHVR